MSKQLTDCYYYYYSKCTKPNCEYRHEPSARGHEIICTRWLEDKCFNVHCSNRHFHITKQRSKIPCYFETTPNGCTKPHCVFLHSKPKNNNCTGQPNLNEPTAHLYEQQSSNKNSANAAEEITVAAQSLSVSGDTSSLTNAEVSSRVIEGVVGNVLNQTLDSSGINSTCEEDLPQSELSTCS